MFGVSMKSKSMAITVAATALVASISAFMVVLLYDGRGAPSIVIEDAPAEVEIAVSVEGAVTVPGVYYLSGDARLIDAITAAGGFSPSADVTRLNLAERLLDEQQIVIPALVHGFASPVADSPEPVATNSTNAVDINTADIEALDQLPGIGPAIAQRIIDYREAQGPFTRVEELARVDGISPAMVEELNNLITVGP